MSAFRPLPPRPSLEFERKEAKALLRHLRAGAPEALERARPHHPTIAASASGSIKLADAQLVIAREYGFTSWPRLVRYFGDLERQRHGEQQRWGRPGLPADPRFHESLVRSLLGGHRERRTSAGRALASYVPHFYGKPLDEVFAAAVGDDDARLAVARQWGCPSWEAFLERSAENAKRPTDGWEPDPIEPARKAIAAGDLNEVQRLVDAHPQLLDVRDDGRGRRPSLLGIAMAVERQRGVEALRPIIDWLGARGFDLQRALNQQLCGRMRMDAETVRYLLERGADPNWVAPSGIPVLEHALIKYWNGAAVDVLAARATPRKALWIAAGLGDVAGVRGSLDAQGKPKPAARRLRPEFDAVGGMGGAQHPDPDDEEILFEAFLVAMLNGRTEVLTFMMSRGVAVNSLIHDSPMINLAVGNRMTAVVECLVRGGADVDIKGRQPNMSAREMARELFEGAPQDAECRRIAELCGLDPDAVIAALDARPRTPPTIHPQLQKALELANDDAVRLGQSEVGLENLLFGVLRNRALGLSFFTRISEMDLDRFRTDFNHRMLAAANRVQHSPLPLNPEARAMVEAATAIATERRSGMVHELHLLSVLTRDEHGSAIALLREYGGNVSKMVAELERGL